VKFLLTAFETCKALLERFCPWLAAFGFAYLYWDLLRDELPPRDFGELLQASLNVASIGIGFLISAKAILLSITNSRIIKKLRAEGSFSTLIGYFISATEWSACIAFFSAALLWLDLPNPIPREKQVFVLLWTFLCGGSVVAALRVIWLFSKLVRKTAAEPEK
jgi:hypothetical protein